jgi:hypothetical protein
METDVEACATYLGTISTTEADILTAVTAIKVQTDKLTFDGSNHLRVNTT